MYRQLMLLVALFFLSIVSVAHAEYVDGVDALEKGDYAKAYKEFKTAAEQGNPAAQYNLGFMYETKKGVQQNYVEAAKHYRNAAIGFAEKEPKPNDSLDFIWFLGTDTNTTGQALASLQEHKQKRIILHTVGGTVSDAIGFYDAIKYIKKLDLTIIGVGQVSSSGVIIFCSGRKRLITKNTVMLLHPVTTPAKENSKGKYRKEYDEQDVLLTRRYAQIVSSATGGKTSFEEILQMMQEHTILTAWEIVEKGIADDILED